MKKLTLFPGFLGSLLLLSFFSVSFTSAPPSALSEDDLEGAWRMVLNRDQAMSDLKIDMVKILVDGHFMFAFYNKDQQSFYSCGGGNYQVDNGVYTESILFHTIDPNLVGQTLSFEAEMIEGKWHQTGAINGAELHEVYQRIEGTSASELMGAWHIAATGPDDHSLRQVKKRQAQTWKLIAGDRYSWATFSPKKGELLSCGGGTITQEESWCRESIEYDSIDSTMVGKVMAYEGLPESDTWRVRPPATRGNSSRMLVAWEKMPE